MWHPHPGGLPAPSVRDLELGCRHLLCFCFDVLDNVSPELLAYGHADFLIDATLADPEA